MTRGEKMYDAVRFLKECVGDSVTVGCGVPLMAAAGVFDYCQVSCDCSPDWFPPLTLASREQNSTYRALVDLIFHRQLAGRAFGLFNNVLPLTNKAFLFHNHKSKEIPPTGLYYQVPSAYPSDYQDIHLSTNLTSPQ